MNSQTTTLYYLIKYLIKSKYKYIINTHNPITLNKSINSTIFKIYDNIYNSFNKKYNLINYTTSQINNVQDIIKPKIFTDTDFKTDIINHINKNSKTNISFVYSIQENTKITIHFITEDKTPNIDIFKKNALKVIQVYNFLGYYARNKKCYYKNTSFFIYFTSLIKKLPINKYIAINENNVNTGFTIPCSSDIVIYRQEEWYKVLIHELIHNVQLDFTGMHNNSNIKNKIKEIVNVRSDILIFEAYTEFWADFINCCIYSFNISKHSKYKFDVILLNTLKFECCFKSLQMLKVLEHYNMDYIALINGKYKNYTETTNVLCYYLFSTMLFFNCENFLFWCNKNNNTLIQFNETNENIYKFCDLLKLYSKNNIFINYISNIQKIKKTSSNNDFFNKTMRITLFG